ncbi:MAG: acyl-CoA dehydrogenase family protein [Gammaproteobacteria bacterium AqS3]|nr:acyl-CoA dehydrogenase family protein [Gammaproteobacteria bacterium AqS3]
MARHYGINENPLLPPHFTDAHRALIESTREFTLREVLPLANRLDPEQGQMPRELIEKMAEMGHFGILIDEARGGLGLGVLEYCLVTEELARGWMSVASIIARGNGMIGGLPACLEDEILPRMARGEHLGAFAMSEPGAGSDVASIRTRAERDGDEWVLSGQKMWCTFADEADFLTVVARTEPYDPAHRHQGVSQFYVPKQRGGFPEGISGTPMRKIGYHGWKTWELSLDGVRIPLEYRIEPGGRDAGDDAGGFRLAAQALAVPRVHTAARAIGLARGALEDAADYAQQREQFDRPISDFQAIRFKLAQMATQIEAARQLTYAVAASADAGAMQPRQAAMCKLFASDMAEAVTSEALQIFGGAGYTSEFAVERHWRDARLTRIFEGTSEIQHKIISDSLLPRPGSAA